MMDLEQNSTTDLKDNIKKKSAGVSNGHITLSSDQSETATESSIELESMDDGSSESEHSTSTISSPSVATTKASSKKDSVISNNIMSATCTSNNNNYRHAAIVPDTTSIISSHQELRAVSPSSQQMNKIKLIGQSPSFSLSASIASSKPLAMAGQTVAPPMTMLSPFMSEFKAPVENLSLGGYMELITLQQGGGTTGANSASGSTLQHISGTSISNPSQMQTGLSGLTNHITGGATMPISVNPHPLSTVHPPHYSSQPVSSISSDSPRMLMSTSNHLPLPQVTNTALLSLQPSPAKSSRPNFSHTPPSAFHQPVTAFTNLLPGGIATCIPQHPSTMAASTVGNKLNLLQPTDFAPGANLNHSLPHSLPQHNGGGGAAAMCNGGGVTGGTEVHAGGHGSGGHGSGGNGRRAIKRTHEESMQQERSNGSNDHDVAGSYDAHMGTKMNMFPTDVGGCGPIVGVDGIGTGRRGSTSDPLTSQPLQQLKWQAHMVNEWHGLCDGALQDIPKIGFQVETDKGFNFSLVDDSFVCQKKNHFQVTITIVFHRTPKFLKLKDGSIQPIERFVLDLHGVRFEQVNSCIILEQSKADRTKTKFERDVIEVPSNPDEPVKRTICRLHFSETTQNNMRKRGKPNPDQKHFSLVVSLNAETKEGNYLIVAHVSERIIVRASNPGNFDNDCDYAWLRGMNPEVVYHHGRVGINMDKPEEALSINGNLHLTGQILQVSDYRVKKNIVQLDSRRARHLENVSQLQLYEYQLDENVCPNAPTAVSDLFNHRNHKSPNYVNDNFQGDPILQGAMTNEGSKDNLRSQQNSMRSKDLFRSENAPWSRDILGSEDKGRTSTKERSELGVAGAVMPMRRQVGLLAQEVKRVLPNAVRTTDSTAHLSDGTSVPNLLVVDKDQILMETIGAVQELKHIASGLQQRLTALEEGHCSNDLSKEGQHYTTISTGIRIRNWPARWHSMLILGLLMIVSFLLFFTPLLLA